MRNVRRVHLTDIWSWYRVELRVGDHLGRSEELVSRCVECDLAEPESLASLGGSAPGLVDGILSEFHCNGDEQLMISRPDILICSYIVMACVLRVECINIYIYIFNLVCVVYDVVVLRR